MNLPWNNLMRCQLNKFALIFFIVSAPACFASGSVVVGGEAVTISAPNGLENAEPAAPKLVKEARKFVGQKSRFLAIFVLPSAIRESNAGKESLNLSRYAIVTTQISGESVTVSLSDFRKIQSDLRKKNNLWLDAKILDDANKTNTIKNSGWQAEKGTLEQLISISPRHITLAANASMRNTSTSQNLDIFYTSTIVLVKGKIITLNMYYNTPSKNDLNDAANIASTWAQTTLVANGLSIP